VSFYQKYRPRKISELDLVSVRESLESVLKSGKLSHAYLFVGPRGSGKTSTARILAQIVNCEKNVDKKSNLSEPCGECSACLSILRGSSVDVIEVDAASSGLVDDIRDLREKVRLSPTHLQKKVYIIDEVHMVSTAGFNALLKTLEEPPKHAMFILCTTESQKVPETIVSRCCRVNFTKASISEVVGSLMKAVNGEGLDINEEALGEIAEATDGSFREGHKLLEQIATHGKSIDSDLVLQVLGIVGKQSVKDLVLSAKKRNSVKIVKSFGEMEKSGIKAQVLAASLLAQLKDEMEEALERGFSVVDDLKLIDELINATDKIKISPLPLLPLEIALLSLSIEDDSSGRSASFGGDKDSEKNETTESEKSVKSESTEIKDVKTDSVKKLTQEEKIEDASNVVVHNYDGPLVSLEKIKMEWMDFLNVMSSNYGPLAGMLRLVSPVDMNGKSLTLAVTSKFQQDILERDVKKKLIEEQMAKIWGPMTFRCVLGEKEAARIAPEPSDVNVEPLNEDVKEDRGIVAAAEEIFGG
jgi:DNA polymerase-3 subunit gamma/tau